MNSNTGPAIMITTKDTQVHKGEGLKMYPS